MVLSNEFLDVSSTGLAARDSSTATGDIGIL